MSEKRKTTFNIQISGRKARPDIVSARRVCSGIAIFYRQILLYSLFKKCTYTFDLENEAPQLLALWLRPLKYLNKSATIITRHWGEVVRPAKEEKLILLDQIGKHHKFSYNYGNIKFDSIFTSITLFVPFNYQTKARFF